MFGAGARLILVFALFGALAVWPYANDCGSGLFGYLGAEAVIVAGGLWVAFTTWRARLPKLHVLSLLIVLTGLVLIAAEVLPRTGYATVDPKHPPQMWCPAATSSQPSVTSETEAEPAPGTIARKADTPATTTMTSPQTMGTLPSAGLVGQRVRYAKQSMENRWQESSGDLVRQLRPRQDVLERIARPELRSRRDP
jgi:hypothetical protein